MIAKMDLPQRLEASAYFNLLFIFPHTQTPGWGLQNSFIASEFVWTKDRLFHGKQKTKVRKHQSSRSHDTWSWVEGAQAFGYPVQSQGYSTATAVYTYWVAHTVCQEFNQHCKIEPGRKSVFLQAGGSMGNPERHCPKWKRPVTDDPVMRTGVVVHHF